MDGMGMGGGSFWLFMLFLLCPVLAGEENKEEAREENKTWDGPGKPEVEPEKEVNARCWGLGRFGAPEPQNMCQQPPRDDPCV